MAFDFKTSLRKASRAGRTQHRIEIYVDRMEQLFNSMDPSPFHERDLDHDAEEFIVSWAQEFHRRDPLLLRIHVNQPLPEADSPHLVEKGVHNYFSYRATLGRAGVEALLEAGRYQSRDGFSFSGILLAGGRCARATGTRHAIQSGA